MDHSLHSYLKRLPTKTLELLLSNAAYERQTQQQTKILIEVMEILQERQQNSLNRFSDIFFNYTKE